MKVILLEKIGRLGSLGDQVEVKPGYARNHLIPTGLAVRATKTNIAYFEERRAELEKAQAEKLTAAKARVEKLEALEEIKIEVQAGEEGKLFGSVGTRELALAITEAGVEVCKSEVLLPEGALRHTGEYEINMQLHSEVFVLVKIQLIPEAE